MTDNVAAATSLWNLPNYIGELFQVGQKKTPFLNMMGGLGGTNAMMAKGWEFPLGLSWQLEAASQPSITETAAIAAGTPETYVPAQATNVAQIFKRDVSVSYVAQSDANSLSGLAQLGGDNPIPNKLDFQIMANLKQIAWDADYTFLNGSYQKATDSGTASKTRGIIPAVVADTTNYTAVGGALTVAAVDGLAKKMADSGAPMDNLCIFVNSWQKQRLTKLFAPGPLEPVTNTIGGVVTDVLKIDLLGDVPVVYAPNVPAADLLLADMAYVQPVFLEVPGKGVLFYEPKPAVGAANVGMVYGQMGIDYAQARFHGVLGTLSTS